jgi:hypothetical protein
MEKGEKLLYEVVEKVYLITGAIYYRIISACFKVDFAKSACHNESLIGKTA